MKTTHISIIALLLVLTSIMATPVSAELVINKYTNEFAASSPYNEQLKLCQCETKVDRVVIENVGQFYANFRLDVRSDYPRNIRVVQNDFELAPKHFQEVLIYIEDSCGLQGVWSYDVTVTNSYGRTQTLSRTIRVDHCENGQLSVTPNNVTVGLCDEGTYRATIKNVGTFPDTFTLDAGQYNGQATFESKSIYLQPDQSYSQDVSFQFACTDWGTKTIPFTLIAEKNGPEAFLTREFTITNEYDYTITMPTDVSVCANVQSNVEVNVENNAPVEDSFRFALKAPAFATLDDSDLTLERREDKDIGITVKPTDKDLGTYTLTLYSNDAYGGLSKERDLKLTVSDCYDPAIEIRKDPTTVLTTPVTMCCGPATFYVNLQNDGDREVVYLLTVDGPTLFSLDETTVRLQPGQNMNVPLRATMPCADETYTAVVYASPKGLPQLNVSASVTVNSQTQRTCHMVQIDDDELCITQDTNIIPVLVKHTGIAGGIYEVSGDETLFRILENNLSLNPGDQRVIHLVPTVNLSTQELGRKIVQPVLTLESLNIPYNEHVGIELKGKGFFQRLADWFFGLPWGQLGVCGWLVVLLFAAFILLVILLLLVYAGRIGFGAGLSRRTLLILKSILVVIVLLLLIAIALAQWPSGEMRYERVANTTNATVIEWYQNTAHQINANEYFTDPDMDILSYSASQPRDVKVTIEGSRMTLTPDRNFVGENTMVITANDRKGGVTDSPVFILRVIPEKRLGLFQWLHVWCVHLNLLALILIVLALFLLVLAVPETRMNDRSKNVLVVVEKPQDAKAREQRIARQRAAAAFVAAAQRRAGKTPAKKASVKTTAKRSAKKAAKKPSVKTASTRSSSKRSVKGVKRSSAKTASTRSTKSKALAVIPTKRAVTGSSAREGVVMREFKGSGQTVNIAVGQPGQQQHMPGSPTIVTVPGAKHSEIVYVGAKGGNTVHTPYCMNARRIPRNKRIAYTTKKEAINAGLVPCRLCRPFEGGM